MVTNSWLEQVREEIVDPERPIIDPHHHLWSDKKGASDYRIEQLWSDMAEGHNVVGTVFVECSTNAIDVGPSSLWPVMSKCVVTQANKSRRVLLLLVKPRYKVVSHADLKLGDAVVEVLEAHREASAGLLGAYDIP